MQKQIKDAGKKEQIVSLRRRFCAIQLHVVSLTLFNLGHNTRRGLLRKKGLNEDPAWLKQMFTIWTGSSDNWQLTID